VPEGAVGAMALAARGGRLSRKAAAPVFKVFEGVLARNEPAPAFLAPGGRGSGCVCHQSTLLTMARLQALTKALYPPDAFDDAFGPFAGSLNKRAMCELFELGVRRARPAAVMRQALPGAARPQNVDDVGTQRPREGGSGGRSLPGQGGGSSEDCAPAKR
jgi:hypothetical protein